MRNLGFKKKGVSGGLYMSDGVAIQPFTAVENLVAYYKLEGDGQDARGTTHGTINNVVATAVGKVNNSIHINNTTGFLNMGNTLQMTGNKTISFWTKLDALSGRQNPYCHAYGGPGAMTIEANGVVNYYYGISGTDGGSYQAFGSTSVLTINIWYHIVIVRDFTNGVLRLYINGVQNNSAPTTYTYAAASTSLTLRVGRGYTNTNYRGLIDEMGFWNKALSPAEVSELYNNGNGLTV